MYGVELAYIPKEKLERWNEIGRRFGEHLNSLPLDTSEECLEKTVLDLCPHLSDEEVEACIGHEINLVKAMADKGGFAAYLADETDIHSRILSHIPLPEWLCPPATAIDETNLDHSVSV